MLLRNVTVRYSETQSLLNIRQQLLKAYCLEPVGVQVLQKWYDDAKIGHMSPRQLIGEHYSDDQLFKLQTRNAAANCKMIISGIQRNLDRKFYTDNVAEEMLSIVFKINSENQTVVPSDRRLLILGEYLLQETKAINGNLKETIEPALSRLVELGLKPIDEREIAYVASIVRHQKSNTAVILAKQESLPSDRDPLFAKNYKTGPEQRSYIVPEAMRGLFPGIDWSVVTNPPLSIRQRKPRIVPADPYAKTSDGHYIFLERYETFQKLTDFAAALKANDPAVVTCDQFADLMQEVAGDKTQVSRYVTRIKKGEIFRTNGTKPIPLPIFSKMAQHLGLTDEQAFGPLMVTVNKPDDKKKKKSLLFNHPRPAQAAQELRSEIG